MNDIRLERIIEASPQNVFKAWLDPKMLASFMRPAPGVVIEEATSDPTVGGKFLLQMNVGESVLPHHGVYAEITEFTRLAFSWISGMAGEASLVTLDFAPSAGGFTSLTLTHTGLPSQESIDAHTGGWTHILGCLQAEWNQDATQAAV